MLIFAHTQRDTNTHVIEREGEKEGEKQNSRRFRKTIYYIDTYSIVLQIKTYVS